MLDHLAGWPTVAAVERGRWYAAVGRFLAESGWDAFQGPDRSPAGRRSAFSVGDSMRDRLCLVAGGADRTSSGWPCCCLCEEPAQLSLEPQGMNRKQPAGTG